MNVFNLQQMRNKNVSVIDQCWYPKVLEEMDEYILTLNLEVFTSDCEINKS